MTPVLAIAFKDLRLMLRDRPGFVFTVLFPLVFGLFFGVIYADIAPGDGLVIGVAAVDESGRWGGVLLDDLEADPRIVLHRFADAEAAAAAVGAGAGAAVLHLPAGFDRWFETLGATEAGAPVLRIDPSRTGEAGVVHGVVLSRIYSAVVGSLADPEASERRSRLLQELAAGEGVSAQDALRLRAAGAALGALGAEAVDRSDRGAFLTIGSEVLQAHGSEAEPPNSFSVTFPQAMIWAVLGSAATFAVGLVGERNAGTLLRLRTTPISPMQILMGKGAACMAVSLGVSLLFVLLGRVFFDVRPVSYPVLMVALLCVSFAFAGIMMLLAVLGRSRTSPGQLAWGVILLMAITGGAMLPLFFMPGWLVAVSHFSPVKWGILALEGGIWRGTTLGEMVLPSAILMGIGALGFAVGARSFVISERACP